MGMPSISRTGIGLVSELTVKFCVEEDFGVSVGTGLASVSVNKKVGEAVWDYLTLRRWHINILRRASRYNE